MAQQTQRCLLCEKPLASGGGLLLTTGCCKSAFHEKCIASHCCAFGREPCPSCGEQVRKLVADGDVDSSGALAARRVKYGRQDYHIFVKRSSSSSNSTLARCAALFDIAPARVKLVAGGRVLTTEAEVEAAAAGGASILCVGTRRAAVVRTETAPRRAMIRVWSVLAATWRVTLKPACDALGRRLPTEAAARAVSPWLSHAWWCGGVFVRSIDPRWKNPYEEGFDRRRRVREAAWGGLGAVGGGEGEAAAPPRAVPPRPQDPGRGPHQFR